MHFYQKCLGGELYFQAIGDSGKKYREMPGKMRNCILHASLFNGPLKLMGSDITLDDGLVHGNSISISLQGNSKTLINKYFKKLSVGGQIIQPIKKTEWGTYFGSLTDRFSKHWLFTYYPKSNSK
jgi:PhnB protein